MGNFSEWLQEQLFIRGWSQADLARESGVSTAQVARILSETRKAGPEACAAFARALKMEPETVFRAAGLLPPKTETVPEFEEVNLIMSKVPQDYRDDIIEYARMKARQAEKKGEYATQGNLGETS